MDIKDVTTWFQLYCLGQTGRQVSGRPRGGVSERGRELTVDGILGCVGASSCGLMCKEEAPEKMTIRAKDETGTVQAQWLEISLLAGRLLTAVLVSHGTRRNDDDFAT